MKSNQESSGGSKVLKGIVAAARHYGVSRQHLRLVLRGDRVSPRIMYTVGKKFPHLLIERVK